MVSSTAAVAGISSSGRGVVLCSACSSPTHSSPLAQPPLPTAPHLTAVPRPWRLPASSLVHSLRTLRISSVAPKNCTSSGCSGASRAKGTCHASGERWKAVSQPLACACWAKLAGEYSARMAATTSSTDIADGYATRD